MKVDDPWFGWSGARSGKAGGPYRRSVRSARSNRRSKFVVTILAAPVRTAQRGDDRVVISEIGLAQDALARPPAPT